MMKIVFETNKGTFAAYLNGKGEIDIYEGADEIPIAQVPPLIKRGPVLDVSADGVATAVTEWLENNYARLETITVIAHLIPPCR